jgi:hypothetical protein
MEEQGKIKVKITQFPGRNYWYSEKLGEEFVVYGHDGENYTLADDHTKIISIKDCVEILYIESKEELDPDNNKYPKGKVRYFKEKPTTEIDPEDIWLEKRRAELSKTIVKYVNSGLTIPIEWVNEFNEFVKGDENIEKWKEFVDENSPDTTIKKIRCFYYKGGIISTALYNVDNENKKFNELNSFERKVLPLNAYSEIVDVLKGENRHVEQWFCREFNKIGKDSLQDFVTNLMLHFKCFIFDNDIEKDYFSGNYIKGDEI